MKRLILVSFLIYCAVITARAQTVYMQKDNGGRMMYIIECVGMPANAYTKTAKSRITNGDYLALGENTVSNLGSEVSNKTVAYKFEVDPARRTEWVDVGWLEAVNLCASLPGGNWRLPTQREFMLMWVLQTKLILLSGFVNFSLGAYHTATERSSSESWVWWSNRMEFYNKRQGGLVYSARCIRDITD